MLRIRARPRIGYRARVRLSLWKFRVSKEKVSPSFSQHEQQCFPSRTSPPKKSRSGTDLGAQLDATVRRLDSLESSLSSIKDNIKTLVAIRELSSESDSSSSSESSEEEEEEEVEQIEPVEGRVTVCQGKDCKKQGASAVLKRVETFVKTAPEMQNVKVKTCKCLDECGKGPAISTKFGKAKGRKHKGVKAKSIPDLLMKALKQSTR